MKNMNITISNIQFTTQDGDPVARIRFNGVDGDIRVDGFINVGQADFFANSGSSEAMTELVRTELATKLAADTPA